MSQTFADIVEDVKQLSSDEKEELKELLRKYLIEENRRKIRDNADGSDQEYRDGKLDSFTSVNDLMDALSHD